MQSVERVFKHSLWLYNFKKQIMTKAEHEDMFYEMLRYVEDQADDGCEISKDILDRYYK